MDTLKSLHIFRAIVEKGSFTLAANHLDISVASASKHLKHLESHVNAKLLSRNNRQQSLTDVGKKYYQDCCLALDAFDNAKAEVSKRTVEPEGVIRITAPIWFANRFCGDLFAEFSEKYPKIQLVLMLENNFTDLIADNIDVALRVTNKPQENIIAKPIVDIKFVYVASANYLERYGKPQKTSDLTKHRGIHPEYIKINTLLPRTHSSSSTSMLAEMVKSGMGIAYLPEWLINDAIHNGSLHLLLEKEQWSVTLYAAYMDRVFLNRKTRLFLDFMSEKFSH